MKERFSSPKEVITFPIITPEAKTDPIAALLENGNEMSGKFGARLEWIVNNQVPCYFISPHYDDAILSAGSLISYLSEQTPSTIVTLFTQASFPPNTKAAKNWVERSGHRNAREHFRSRKAENIAAGQAVGAEMFDCGLVDAAWRRRTFSPRILNTVYRITPQKDHLYPGTTKGELPQAEEDAVIKNQAKDLLKTIVPADRPFVVFAPIALGGHVDHQLTREVVEETFDGSVFWEDFPYVQRTTTRAEDLAGNMNSALWEGPQDKKANGVRAYTSQVQALFHLDKQVKLQPEKYFFNNTSGATTFALPH